MAWYDRREIPLMITAIFGTFILFEYYLDIGPINNVAGVIMKVVSIISGFAMTIGVVNSLKYHGNKILKKEKGQLDQFMSVWLIFVFAVMAISGLVPPIGEHSVFIWLYKNIHIPLYSTVYSLLALWIASASYRILRTKNREALLLLVPAFLVMLGQTPIIIAYFPAFANIRTWLYNVPNKGAMRAIQMSVGIGSIMVALRTILGKERRQILGEM